METLPIETDIDYSKDPVVLLTLPRRVDRNILKPDPIGRHQTALEDIRHGARGIVDSGLRTDSGHAAERASWTDGLVVGKWFIDEEERFQIVTIQPPAGDRSVVLHIDVRQGDRLSECGRRPARADEGNLPNPLHQSGNPGRGEELRSSRHTENPARLPGTYRCPTAGYCLSRRFRLRRYGRPRWPATGTLRV